MDTITKQQVEVSASDSMAWEELLFSALNVKVENASTQPARPSTLLDPSLEGALRMVRDARHTGASFPQMWDHFIHTVDIYFSQGLQDSWTQFGRLCMLLEDTIDEDQHLIALLMAVEKHMPSLLESSDHKNLLQIRLEEKFNLFCEYEPKKFENFPLHLQLLRLKMMNQPKKDWEKEDVKSLAIILYKMNLHWDFLPTRYHLLSPYLFFHAWKLLSEYESEVVAHTKRNILMVVHARFNEMLHHPKLQEMIREMDSTFAITFGQWFSAAVDCSLWFAQGNVELASKVHMNLCTLAIRHNNLIATQSTRAEKLDIYRHCALAAERLATANPLPLHNSLLLYFKKLVEKEAMK